LSEKVASFSDETQVFDRIQRTAHRASLTEMNALFASLQHRAFRSEL